MSRMQTTALKSLIGTADAGGYTLPDELLTAWNTYQAVQALTLPELPQMPVDAAAARLVASVTAGDPLDLLEVGRDAQRVEDDRQAVAIAQRVLAEAIEQADNAVSSLAADLTERIITEHLRPAYQDVLSKAHTAGAALEGYGLDPHTLLQAPAKARGAYFDLSSLVERRTAIWTARRNANAIGYRTVQHDTENRFLEFANPLAFHPNLPAAARFPGVPAPEDPKAHLLWLITPEATAAKPWLPTPDEQDQAWHEVYGAAVENRRVRAVAARAYAGQQV